MRCYYYFKYKEIITNFICDLMIIITVGCINYVNYCIFIVIVLICKMKTTEKFNVNLTKPVKY